MWIQGVGHQQGAKVPGGLCEVHEEDSKCGEKAAERSLPPSLVGMTRLSDRSELAESLVAKAAANTKSRSLVADSSG
jgi:hypothetical protein